MIEIQRKGLEFETAGACVISRHPKRGRGNVDEGDFKPPTGEPERVSAGSPGHVQDGTTGGKAAGDLVNEVLDLTHSIGGFGVPSLPFVSIRLAHFVTSKTPRSTPLSTTCHARTPRHDEKVSLVVGVPFSPWTHVERLFLNGLQAVTKA